MLRFWSAHISGKPQKSWGALTSKDLEAKGDHLLGPLLKMETKAGKPKGQIRSIRFGQLRFLLASLSQRRASLQRRRHTPWFWPQGSPQRPRSFAVHRPKPELSPPKGETGHAFGRQPLPSTRKWRVLLSPGFAPAPKRPPPLLDRGCGPGGLVPPSSQPPFFPNFGRCPWVSLGFPGFPWVSLGFPEVF